MRIHKKPFRKPEDAWNQTKKGIQITYPLFWHDTKIPHDPMIKKSIKEVLGDIDFWGWESKEEDRIVDATGKVFTLGYETLGSRGSGLFPAEYERTMEIGEIKELLKLALEHNKSHIREDLNELKGRIDAIDSIQEMLSICSKYF